MSGVFVAGLHTSTERCRMLSDETASPCTSHEHIKPRNKQQHEASSQNHQRRRIGNASVETKSKEVHPCSALGAQVHLPAKPSHNPRPQNPKPHDPEIIEEGRQTGGCLGAGLGEAEDVVHEEQHIL